MSNWFSNFEWRSLVGYNAFVLEVWQSLLELDSQTLSSAGHPFIYLFIWYVIRAKLVVV